MKKFLFVFLTVLLISELTVFATENDSETTALDDKFSVGTFALVQCRKSGGGVAFGIPCFQKNAFFIKDEINLNLYLSNPVPKGGMYLSVGDKLHFGSLKEYNGFGFRSYGYCKVEFGFTKDSTYGFMTAPMILETGGAGGFEFLFSKSKKGEFNKGFFVEFGGGCVVKGWGEVDKSVVAGGGFDGSYVCLTTGLKHYF
ncbi:MAG: hypothetical protein K6G52_01695 [Treponemataceae bacterium]|nr:hypothetical protein [Treponemataceae bacterium]